MMLALLVFGAVAGQAGSVAPSPPPQATGTQELEATVNSEVSWGSANGCTQNVETNNFGVLTPNATRDELGSFDALPHSEASTAGVASVWVGCVTTNAELASVTAAGTQDMRDGEGTRLPLSDVGIGITNGAAGKINGGIAGCEVRADQSGADGCTLERGAAAQTLVTGADEGTTELDWQYQLNLPANQPVGSYTGGQVTFTASAGAFSATVAPRSTSTPSFTGTPTQGQSVGLVGVGFSGRPTPRYTYQWRDCTTTSLNSCSDIPGATASVYTPGAVDQGLYLSALITATNTAGSSSTSVVPMAVNATYMQAVEADHPVADWTLNDPAGSSAAGDAAGWGALSGGTHTFGVAGPFPDSGTAVGLTAPMSHGGTPLSSFTTFTAEVWFKASTADVEGTSDEYIFANQEGAIWLGLGSCFAKVEFAAGNCLNFVWQGTGRPVVQQTGYRFTDTNWHYLVMTHGADGRTHVYVDGTELGSYNSSSIYNGFTFGTVLGGINGLFGHYAYYNSELSAQRVAVHWEASKTS